MSESTAVKPVKKSRSKKAKVVVPAGHQLCKGCSTAKPVAEMKAWCRGTRCTECYPKAQAQLAAARVKLAEWHAARKAERDAEKAKQPAVAKKAKAKVAKKAAEVKAAAPTDADDGPRPPLPQIAERIESVTPPAAPKAKAKKPGKVTDPSAEVGVEPMKFSPEALAAMERINASLPATDKSSKAAVKKAAAEKVADLTTDEVAKLKADLGNLLKSATVAKPKAKKAKVAK